MIKQKYVVFGVSAIVVLAGLGAGSYYLYGSVHHKNLSGQSFDALHTDTSSLGSTTAQSSESSGTTSGAPNIAVGTNSADSYFGQLGNISGSSQGNTQTQSNSGGQSTPGTGSGPSPSSASSSNNANNALDPSTFGQYNASKYVNGSSTFFADLQTGTGTSLTAGHQASVLYKGWLTNGTLFDETKTNSSGQMVPFTFAFGTSPSQVITGWQEGLNGMKVGGIRLLIIPPAVGYGATGQGPIPGNAVLIFAVELVSVT